MKTPEQRQADPQKAGKITDRKQRAGKPRRKTAAAVALCALMLDPVVAGAAMPVGEMAEDMFADLAPLAPESLDAMRGGFRVGNLDINVGVTVTTSIQGLVDVTSNFSINAPGDLRNLSSEITATTRQAAGAARDAVGAAKDAAEQAIGTANAQAAAAMAAAREKLEAQLGNMPASPAAPTGGNNGAPAPQAPAPQAPAPTAPAAPTTPATPAAPPPASMPGGSGAPAVEVPAPTIVTDSTGAVTHVVTVNQQPAQEAAPIPVSPETVAEIIHRVTPDGGHTSVITNRMNNVSISQNVAVDLSVDNFSAMQAAAGIQQAITGIVQQIGVLSLRR